MNKNAVSFPAEQPKAAREGNPILTGIGVLSPNGCSSLASRPAMLAEHDMS
jgi:hypothetical protein